MEKKTKTFVGFGFGPIQSGLFLYEAYLSGAFRRFVVSEIDRPLVEAIHANGGRYSVNIARPERIDTFMLEGIELYDPRAADGREALLDAIAESDEMATALPRVDLFDAGGAGSVVRLLNDGIGRRAALLDTVVYAAENNNRAAEILDAKLNGLVRRPDPKHFQTLNTVVGKMSGVIMDPEVIARLGLTPMTPDTPRAILIEAFNRILVSRIGLPGYARGIDVFEEKENLLPFEEAKLYGHNAIHALIAYLADLKDLDTIAEAGRDTEIMHTARQAFLNESGPALIHRNASTGDPLFTPAGYRAYAEDLLERMVCPNLNDRVARVGRDHVRKLGYHDRLFGAMHLALEAGVAPVHLARGAAAGVLSLIERRAELQTPLEVLPAVESRLTPESLRRLLLHLWGAAAGRHAAALIDLTWQAVSSIRS